MRVIIRIAWRNLLRHWRRSSITMLAVATGVVALVLLRGFVADLRHQFELQGREEAMYGDLTVRKKIPRDTPASERWKVALDPSEQTVIERVLAQDGWGVSTYIRRLLMRGLASNGRTNALFFGVGYDVQQGAAMRGERWAWNTPAGKPLHTVDSPQRVVLGRGLSAALGCDGALHTGTGTDSEPRALDCETPRIQLQAMTINGQLNALNADIVGVVEPRTRAESSQLLMADLSTLQTLFDTTSVNNYNIALTDRTRSSALRAALLQAGEQAGVVLLVEPWQASPEGDSFRALMDLLNVFSAIVLLASGSIVAGTVMSLLGRIVAERTREIGTLRSVGYRRWHIVSMFSLEGVLIATIGGMIGALFSVPIATIINHAGIEFTGGLASVPLPLQIRLAPWDFVWVGLVLIALAWLSTLAPARRAGRVNVNEALTHV